MGNINRVPQGLLSLLDTQTQGQAPANLLNEISPTLEMTDFWYCNKGLESQFEDETLILNGASFDSPLVVPQGEVWAVKNVSAEASLADAASGTYRISSLYRLPSLSTNFHVLSYSGNFAGILNSVGSCGANFERPLLAGPGSTFDMRLDHTSAVLVLGFACTVTVLFYRLKI